MYNPFHRTFHRIQSFLSQQTLGIPHPPHPLHRTFHRVVLKSDFCVDPPVIAVSSSRPIDLHRAIFQVSIQSPYNRSIMSELDSEDVKLPLQVAIDKQKTRVLIAQADGEFVDVLASFLTLPLGRILRLFQKHYGDEAPVIGSLHTLYKGLANLDDAQFCTKECKQMLLDPRNSFSYENGALKLNIDDSPTSYFLCQNYAGDSKPCYNKNAYMFGNSGSCYYCKTLVDKEVHLEALRPCDIKAFTKRNMSFTIGDDLQMVSNASSFPLQTALKFGVTNTDGWSLTTVQIGLNDAMELLKGLFVSQTPISDLILKKRPTDHPPVTAAKHQTEPKAASSNTLKYVIKAVYQKSTNNFLFVEAKNDFVDFIFSLLAMPLGAVVHLLGGNTCYVSLDNLYQSVFNLDQDCYLMKNKGKDLLLKFPWGYLSKYSILPLGEHRMSVQYTGKSLFPATGNDLRFVDPKGSEKCYIREQRMFMVTDELIVTPLNVVSVVSHLNAINVPVSDVEEVGIKIGVEEALRILKASLTSTTVLTDALKPVLKRKPKQECGV